MAVSNYWRYVDNFSVSQAAALFCGCEPARGQFLEHHLPADFRALKQALTGAVQSGALRAGNTDTAGLLNDYSQSTIERADLIAWAESKSLRPAFLFDTLLPVVSDALDTLPSHEPPPATGLVTAGAAEKNKGGRPREYDWDGAVHEIIRIADADCLPKTQADLVRSVQDWFQRTYGKEPAVSELKQRVSAIYSALKKQGWEPKDGG